MIVKRPDIITKETKIIELGSLDKRLVTLTDSLIDKNKKCNNSLYSGYWITLDGEIYYFKVPPFTQGYLNELLGEKISLEFGLETVHQQLASAIIKINGIEKEVYGLLSKWARTPGYNYHMLKYEINHKRLQDTMYNKNLKSFDNSNLSILEYIDKIYQNQPICEQLRALIAREFFTQEIDRLESEILMATKNNKIELGYLTDYECEWLNVSSKYSNGLLTLDLSEQQTISQIQQDQFFQTSFTKALKIDVIYLLEQIQEEHKIRLIDYDKNNYKEKSEFVKTLIRRKKLVS